MLGVTMTEMILGKSAVMGFFRFGPRSVKGICKRIDKAVCSKRISKDTAGLLKSMLEENPDSRPSAEDLMSNHYFQKDIEKLNKLGNVWGKVNPSNSG